MVVCKFGGAVLATPQGFPTMASVVAGQASDPVVVVVSAFGSTTRLLDTALECSRSGDGEGARRAVAALDRIHGDVVDMLGLDSAGAGSLHQMLSDYRAALQTLLQGIATTRQCTPRVRDRVLSWGEDLAREITVRWLQSVNIDCVGVPARSVIVTTDDFGAAQPLSDATARHASTILKPLLEDFRVVVVEGFVGQSTSGDCTTMGRESSNLTATLLASVLGASMVTIFTDVEGVRSADPHLFDTTEVRPHLTYTQARVAAEAGVKLLYPSMMEPAEHAGIPIRIASAITPNGASTIIDGLNRGSAPIVVGADLGDNRFRCTTLHVDPLSWFSSVTTLLSAIHDLAWCDVITDHASQRADLVVPTSVAHNVLERLHSTLCLGARDQ